MYLLIYLKYLSIDLLPAVLYLEIKRPARDIRTCYVESITSYFPHVSRFKMYRQGDSKIMVQKYYVLIMCRRRGVTK